MKRILIFTLIALTAICFCNLKQTLAAGAPDIIWEVPTPNGLANSIVGVGWAPGASGQTAMGSTDRWLRTRQGSDGALIYSILGPQHSSGGDQTIYSTDGQFLAVHNRGRGTDYRVYRAADGTFLGMITVTFDANGIVQFTPDAQLQGSVPPDGTITRWHFDEFTVITGTGSGYHVINTTFNFSPDGNYQSVATQGTIKIVRRANGALVSSVAGGEQTSTTPVKFTPDSTGFAVWDTNANQTTLWRVSDGTVRMRFPDAVAEEGLAGIRFTPDGTKMVTTGYLAFQDSSGWQQVGTIRFWRLADGVLLKQFDQHTGIAVTSAIAFSPGAAQFIYGTYEGTVAAARTPSFRLRNEER